VTRWSTFDCYGTLIDWDAGVRGELARVFGPERVEEQFARYHDLEPELEADGTLPYRDVMAEAMRRLGAPAGEEAGLAESMASWQPFPEVSQALEEARARGWKLAILSNSDPDMIAASKALIGVPFDETIVAGEIGSYKPAPGHWREFSARTGADPSRHVHVGASLFHDVAPARGLGLPTVWVNRLGETADPEPDVELRDLAGLPDALDGLVP
jgi:2-haloalkanoic acid dehalogenase type II